MSTYCTNEPPCVPQPGTCLYYSGNPIVLPNIQSGDNFNTVVNKLTTYISSLGANVTGINLGTTGPVIFAGKVGNEFQFKRILAGTNVTINETGTSVTINASAPTAADGGILSINGLLGVSQSMVVGTSGSDFNISSTGSTHIFNLPVASSISSGKLSSSDWTLFNSKIGNAVSLGFGEPVYKQQVGVTLQFKSILVTGGLAITSNGDEIIIDASGVDNSSGEVATMTNLGTVGGRIYSAKIGTEFQLRRVAAGAGITVTENATQVVVTNSAPDVPVVINGGTNITVSGSYPNFTISATDTGETNTMANVGTGVGVYSTKIGTEFKMRNILAGAGVTVTLVGEDIVIGAGAGVADGNNYPTSLDLSGGVLTLGRFGLTNLTTNVTTDVITEGTTNLFYTDARVYGSLTGGTGITVNPGTGEITNTGIVTADNGLTKTGNNVQLGGPLIQNTTINAGSVYNFIITSTRATTNYTLKVENTGTGLALYATSVDNAAVSAFSTNSSGVFASSTNGYGITATSNVSAADFQVNNANANSVANALYLTKFTTGAPAIGHGVSMTFGAETDSGAGQIGLKIAMDWTTIINASRTSRMTLTVVDSGVDKIFMRGLGSGQMVLPQYGDNLFTGTPTYGLAVDTNGNVIEVALGGGAVTYTADNGLTMTANNVQLGGTLIQNTTIDAGSSYALTLIGTVSGAVLNVNAGGATAAVFTNTNVAGVGSSHTAPNIPLWSINDNASNSTVQNVFQGSRNVATGAFGLGVSHQYNLVNNAGSIINAGGFRYYWTDAVAGSEKTAFALSLSHNSSTQDRLILSSTGALKLNAYGVGAFSGTAVKQLAVDATGNVIEINLSGGGAELTTASNGLNLLGYDVKLGGVLTDTVTTITAPDTKRLVFTSAHVGSSTTAGFQFLNTVTDAVTVDTVYITNASTLNGTALRVVNSGSGGAIVASSTITTTISASSTTATTASFTSTSGNTISGLSTTGKAMTLTVLPSTTNTVVTVATFSRQTTGTPANGIGAAIELNAEDSAGSGYTNVLLAGKWTDVNHATNTGQFEISIADNGSVARRFFFTGPGYLGLDVTPQNDDALGNILVYDTVSKLVKYRTVASIVGNTVFSAKTDITTNANWNIAYDASAGIALHEVLKVGDATANDMRTITINAVAYITQANFTTGTWVQIGTTTYNPQNTVYFRGSTRIDATKFENSTGTEFVGFNLYDDMNLRVDATGNIFVYIANINNYATLSGGNIVVVPIHITYFISLAS